MYRGCIIKNCTSPETIKQYFSLSINFNEDKITKFNIV